MIKHTVSIIYALFLFLACDSNDQLSPGLVGTWQVKAEINEDELISSEGISGLSSELDLIKNVLLNALQGLDLDLTIDSNGEEIHVSNENLEDGLGQIGAGLAKLLEGFGNSGIDLISQALESVSVIVELQEDGTIIFYDDENNANSVDLNADEVIWRVEDGLFILGDGNDEIEFEIRVIEGGYALVRNGITLILTQP